MTMQSRLATFVCGSVMIAMMLVATTGCSCIRGPWIVGTWKTEAFGMEVQYEFKKNGTVIERVNDNEERGKWRLDGNKLILSIEDEDDRKLLISDKSSKSFTATIVGTPMVLEFTRK